MRSLLTAAAISLAFTLFLTPLFLRLFRKWGWGQVIRTPEDIRNPNHQTKRGTPTMGGTIFIAGTIVGYLVGGFSGGNPPTISGLLVLWMMVGLGAVGFIDDYMKVRQQKFMGLS
nr:phospho-N-acetylmuramoyl-pentapeptide-transferase [Actinomycetota bacterium]